MLTKEELENLSELLLSANDENAELALTILSGQKESIEELVTDVFAVYKITSNKSLKEQAILVLNNFGIDNNSQLFQIKKILRPNKNITEEHIKKRISTYVRISKGLLDGVKLAIILFKKYKIGIAYIWEYASLEQQRFFFKYFIEGTTFTMPELNLTEIPEALYTFENLTSINLSKNKLSFIPAKLIQTFPNLQELNLSYNSIPEIPNEILDCKNMKVLDLRGNQLSSLPSKFIQLDKLEKLLLLDNSFEKNPECIAKLKKMKLLAISLNYLEIPPELGELENLEGLILHLPNHTDLLEIPNSYKKLKRLKMFGFRCVDFEYKDKFFHPSTKKLGRLYKEKFKGVLLPDCKFFI